MIDFELHEQSWALIPTVTVTRGECESCGEKSGWMISLTWLPFSLHFTFGGHGHA